MAERQDYDALAQDINLEDITSCERNANILRMLRDGNPNWNKKLFIMRSDNEDWDINDFVIDEGDDLGWLGYFVGKCEVLEELYIFYIPDWGDEINSFCDSMSQNRSIEYLYICDDIGVDGWSRLGNFLENNRNLERFTVEDFLMGHWAIQNIALALGRMKYNSLKYLSMKCNEIGDEGLSEIATALRSQSQLECLHLGNNSIGRDGCIALANTLSRLQPSNKFQLLNLGRNAIDDGGLQVLAEGLMKCQSFKTLDLSDNRSITEGGLRSLFPLLQSESLSLERLDLSRIAFGDDGAIVLVDSLRGNKSLKELLFSPSTSGISAVGWSAFSTLLCDTSTINNTYLSNHKLRKIGCYGDGNEDIPEVIQRLLRTNRNQNRQGPAICKILQSHPDLDMEPFFKSKMKFLPAIMSWFERVEPIEEELIEDELIEESERSCQSRKLSALYKFVRGMPDLTTIGYWEGRVIEIEAKKCRIADERRRLQDEMRRLDDEERRLGYEKKGTLERLGDQPVDELNRNNKRMRLK